MNPLKYILYLSPVILTGSIVFTHIPQVQATDVTVNATVPAICGNGFIEGAEQCDGNTLNGATCVTRGFDQGNLSCSNACQYDTTNCSNNGGGGGALPANNNNQEPPQDEEEPNPVCGNGALEGEEQCDDGNNLNGDGCTFLCILEQPAQCGNGVQEAGEDCDDGNNIDGDGCTIQCVQEQEEPPPEKPIEVPPQKEPQQDNQNDNDQEQPPENQPQENNDVDHNIPPKDNPNNGGRNDAENNNIQQVRVLREHIHIFLANSTIPSLAPEHEITTLSGDTVLFRIREQHNSFTKIERITLQGANIQKLFVKTKNPNAYQQSFIAPHVGSHPITLTVTYTDNTVDSFQFTLKTLSYGRVSSGDTPIDIATITLLDATTGAPFNMGTYAQVNPIESTDSIGYIVPNGSYKLQIKAEGYHTRITPAFIVTNNVVNLSVSLIKKELPIKEQIDPNATKVEQAKQLTAAVTKKVTEQAKLTTQRVIDTAKKLDTLADDPKVEHVNEQVIVPTTAAIATATVVPSLSSTLLPLLRYIFLQPLLLLGRRRRKEWGTVYNSLTKLPIDLAMIRLVDAKTKKVLQSRVTDVHGRFLFIAAPGTYIIEVTKQGFQFPSSILKQSKNDGDFADLYHGESIVVKNDGIAITPNIPIDPQTANQTPKRIVWEKRLRALQHIISMGGIIFTAISLYISPTSLVAGFLILHIVLYGLFIKYAKPKKPEGWGIVYDENTKQPLANAVVRLFTKEYNKLVSTQVTDKKGRYAFLVGPNTYVVQSQKNGYRPFTSENITVEKQRDEAGILKPSVGLKPERDATDAMQR